MKTLVSVALVLGLLFAPVAVNARPDPPPPPMPTTCIVLGIAAVVTGVLVYGLIRCCENMPADQGAPVVPPDLESQLPPPGGIYIFRVPPKLSMGWAMLNQGIEIQHGSPLVDNRSPNWQADYSFRAINNYDGTMSMIASDANGVPLQTNTVSIINWNDGKNYAFFDFSTLGSIPTNMPPKMFFRLATTR